MALPTPLQLACRRTAACVHLTRRAAATYREISRTEGIAGYPHVNARFKQDPPRKHVLPTEDNSSGRPSQRHQEEAWLSEHVRQAAVDHTMLTWGTSANVENLPIIEQAEGVYVYDSEGKRYLDFTSQAVCVNLGHTVPESVKKAMTEQLSVLPFVYGGMALTPVRAKLSSLMADICPGDLDGFLFPSSGGEANDCAIRIARMYTGKSKILNQYRSYHGGSMGPLTATGDFRRHFGGDQATGFVKMFNPEPHYFRWGDTNEQACEAALACLEEQIVAEGPATIAAVMLESIPGSAGVLIPPAGYMEGVRALCNKYDILLICDEVMTGFGRTGKLFAFQHFDGVIPDIFTSAKGLTGSWQPLSVVGVRRKLKESFVGFGSTFQAHPVALACGYACLKHILETRLLEHVQQVVEPVLIEEINRLVAKYPFIRQGRAIGAFSCLDLQDPRTGERPMKVGEAPPAEIVKFKKAYNAEGLIGFLRPPQVHCAPPLIITEAELRDGFARLDRALSVLGAEYSSS